jgi:hypothetical protein
MNEWNLLTQFFWRTHASICIQNVLRVEIGSKLVDNIPLFSKATVWVIVLPTTFQALIFPTTYQTLLSVLS